MSDPSGPAPGGWDPTQQQPAPPPPPPPAAPSGEWAPPPPPPAQWAPPVDPNAAYGMPPADYTAAPGAYPAPQPVYGVDDPRKSKMAAGLLGIFLGTFGVHNFYLGYTGKAIAQLLITVLSCGMLAIVSSIWGIIEGVMILTGSINTDAAGVPLKD